MSAAKINTGQKDTPEMAENNTPKMMAEKLLEPAEEKITRNIKDSVFCDLFGRPEYLYQLYQVLHPEDSTTTFDDFTIVTLSTTIARNIYNDLGFLVGNRLMVLVEAQSTWSENIVIRIFMYLGETYRRYIKSNGLRLYGEKNVILPKPELYVVFTGERTEQTETISLKRDIFGLTEDEDCCVDVVAKVIYGTEEDRDILNQYIIFSKVYDEQNNLYPDDRQKVIQETIRICRERDVLAEYLAREEAAAIMYTFASQVDAVNEALMTEREEGVAIGEARGEVKGENKFATLMDKLLAAGRMEDVRMAVKDKAYRDKLFLEFHIN